MIEESEEPKEPYKQVVNELYKTEISYISTLSDICNLYISELVPENSKKKKSGILAKEEVDIIFSNIPQILELHISLCKKLQAEVSKSEEEQNVGKVFVEVIKKMILYADYFENDQKRLNALKGHMEKHTKFAQMIEANMQVHKCRLDTLLNKPLHRQKKPHLSFFFPFFHIIHFPDFASIRSC